LDRSQSPRDKSSSTTEQGGGTEEDDVTENATDIEALPKDPEATAILMSKAEPIAEEDAGSMEEEEQALDTPTSSQAVEYLDKRKSAAANSKKALQIIKENSEILDKILRKKGERLAGAESFDESEDHETTTVIRDKERQEPVPLQKQEKKQQQQQHLKQRVSANNANNVNNNSSSGNSSSGGGGSVKARVIGVIGNAAATGNTAIKPITFNPFPKPVMRKKKEVGRKLGLYTAN
jgi:hypothetical protein